MAVQLRSISVDPPRSLPTSLTDLRRMSFPTGFVIPAADALAASTAWLVAGGSGAATVYLVAAYISLAIFGTQNARIVPRLADDLGSLLGRALLPMLALAPWLAAHPDPSALRAVPTFAALLVVGRLAAYGALRSARRRNLVLDPTLILGAGQLGPILVDTLQDHPEFGLVPIGFLDVPDGNRLGLPLPVLGGLDDLEEVLHVHGVKRVIVAFSPSQEGDMIRALRSCDAADVEIYVVPRFYELGVAPDSADVEDIWGIPLVRLRRPAFRSTAMRAKRAFDVVIASVAVFVLAPVMAAVALAVRLSGPGPILFKQRRFGQWGEPFDVLKFRSMRINSDSDTSWSVVGDDRVTKVGRFLRASSLDELPQLFNVLRGEMSLVGPRPERPHFVNEFSIEIARYGDRHRLPVGMTGWAQVHGLRGADSSIIERSRFDNRYIEHWSLWQDVVILARTVLTVLKRTPT